MSYLLQLVDELMTTDRETLEIMYNEAMRRQEISDLDDSVKYGKICGVIEQVANKRFYHVMHDGKQYRLVNEKYVETNNDIS